MNKASGRVLKKVAKRMLFVILVVVTILYFFIPGYFTKMITDYDRISHWDVLGDSARAISYDIGNAKGPGDYGFPDFEEIDYPTLFDDLKLNGWYIPASKDSINQTLLIIHGRTSNRLKTMKYLKIIKQYGLDSLYNVFIPDLRNSGKADEAKTAMGYEFSEDIAGSLKMLFQKFGQQHFTLYGFSMGAMASATMINRSDILEELKEDGLVVDKLILESPLSNVRAQIKHSSDDMGVPTFIFDLAYRKFDALTDRWSENMKLSYLLNNTTIPTLILYGGADTYTPTAILENELKSLKQVKTESFEDGGHVRLYTRPEYAEHYAKAVNRFLRDD